MSESQRQLLISVIGRGDDASDRAKELAAEVGRLLARRGATVVCGGLGGVMEAACKGAKSAGGTTVGILPGSDPDAANKWVDIPIATGLGYARNTVVVKAGAAVIAVSGGVRHALRNRTQPRRRQGRRRPRNMGLEPA